MTREEHIYQLKQYLQGKSISMCPSSSLYWQEHWEEVIKALEQEPNNSENPTGLIEIKVGDEVTVAGANGIVVREPYPIGSDNELFVLVWYGQYMSSNSLKNVAPTGRHFPQIIEVLEQLRRSCC